MCKIGGFVFVGENLLDVAKIRRMYVRVCSERKLVAGLVGALLEEIKKDYVVSFYEVVKRWKDERCVFCYKFCCREVRI